MVGQKISLKRDANGNAIQRGLHKIKGLIDGFTGDFTKIGRETITLAYGRGGRGGNTVVGPDMNYGFTVEQNSGSIFALKTDPITGEERKIKINKKRFSSDSGMAELIYSLVVEHKASPSTQLTVDGKGNVVVAAPGEISAIGVSVGRLLANIVNFGGATFIKNEERYMLGHLIPKQFFIAPGNKLVYGENSLDISDFNAISDSDKADLIAYINELYLDC